MDPRYTVHRMEIAFSLKLLNGSLDVAKRFGLRFGKLDAEGILRVARRKTGLDDWGDEGFRVFMDRLLMEADAARCTQLGEIALRQTSYAAVCNRLRIQDYIHKHPELLQIPIERPVFIVGFPRTGTTLLQNLLSIGEGRRALSFWELVGPVPVHPDPRRDREIRIRKARQLLALARFVAPEIPMVHDAREDTKEEDWYLFENTFAVMNFDLASGLVRFGDWLLQQDMVPPYREFKRYLQVLAHWRPTGQFVLKCPEHLWFLDALLEVFPDACIVWPHRDPVRCIASYSSMISLTRRAWYGRIYADHIGGHITDRFFQGVTWGQEVKERVGEKNFYDVRFEDLIRDPVAMAQSIQQHFGLPHGDADARRMRAWMDQPREDEPGKHVYSPEQWGLDEDEIRERFADYIERFSLGTR